MCTSAQHNLLRLICCLWCIGFGLLSGVAYAAEDEVTAKIAQDLHYGAASCAGSACHGKSSRQDNRTVWLNEHRIWRAQDYHSRAYKTLLSPQSKLIASKLGLASAQTADICLDCHADNVPQDKRGPEFSLQDGVGCEACHGGSERWIKTHDDPGVTHADNLAAGLYPTEKPTERAQLCLTCHMGTQSKLATHRIMGAGHPRLSFELENFTNNQPPHFSVDADYRQRKGDFAGVQLWLSGQLEGGRRFLDLLESSYFRTGRWQVEFTFYDCQGCHHGLDPKDFRWYAARREQGIEPGSLRLADHHFRTLALISSVLSATQTASLEVAMAQLVRAGQGDPAATDGAIAAVRAAIDGLANTWQGVSIDDASIRRLRAALVTQAAAGTLVDYGTAEQGLLSIVTLTEYLAEGDAKANAIDRLFEALGNDETFKPSRYQRAAAEVKGTF